jgi:APA family basic amino acid/polyamine antiporter
MVIIADMIGTGIFMTTGNILGITNNALIVILLWVLGGVVALCGALSYSELAVLWPDVGGEYIYLKKIFGNLPAFLTGWVSLIVGFTAPVATSSMLLVQYLNKFFINIHATGITTITDDIFWQKNIAALIIITFGCIHIIGVKRGTAIQNILTVIKIAIVAAFIIAGFYVLDSSAIHRLYAHYGTVETGSIPLIGLSLLMVMFAYTGWNGATYIAGEIVTPEKNLPRIMFWGVTITTVLYILLNIVFLMSTDGINIMNHDEIGAIAANALFGPVASNFFSITIAIILLSSVSAQMMLGPRVYYAMANNNMIFSLLSKISNRFGTPLYAIVLQMILAVVYVYSGTAMSLVIYMGFALNVFPVLTVIGLMVIRKKHPELKSSYRTPLYPLVPLVYVVLTIIMMIAALCCWTITSAFAIGVLLLGIPVYYIWQRYTTGKSS